MWLQGKIPEDIVWGGKSTGLYRIHYSMTKALKFTHVIYTHIYIKVTRLRLIVHERIRQLEGNLFCNHVR